MSADKKLNAAFRELRKLGFVARQTRSGCVPCAFGSIESGVQDKKKKPIGMVLCNVRDVKNWKQVGDLFVHFARIGRKESPAKLARKIMEVLRKQGLVCRWCRNPMRPIEVEYPR